MHIEAINNGMGAPSMYLMVMAGQRKIPCDVVITADTGSENDCLLNTGERITAREYYNDVIEPLGQELGLKTAFVRSLDKQQEPLPPIIEVMQTGIIPGVPMYGSDGGQLKQGCTDKWKIRGIRQELRRMGATTARSALGLTVDEFRRMKKSYVKWQSIWWPLIRPFPTYKATCREQLDKMGIPYMLSSQCDMCPHQNYARWSNLLPETIENIADIEAGFGGTQFFTDQRLPLKEALEVMESRQSMSIFDAPCDSGYCFT